MTMGCASADAADTAQILDLTLVMADDSLLRLGTTRTITTDLRRSLDLRSNRTRPWT